MCNPINFWFPGPSCFCFVLFFQLVQCWQRRERRLLEKNCLYSVWHVEDYTVCSAKRVFSLPRLMLVSTRSIDLSFVGWSMVSLALTKGKLKLPENFGEATKLLLGPALGGGRVLKCSRFVFIICCFSRCRKSALSRRWLITSQQSWDADWFAGAVLWSRAKGRAKYVRPM